jgi:hypothetical protein
MSENEKPAESEITGNVKAVCLLLASAFAGTGAKVMFDGDYVRGGIGIAVGVFFALAGLTFGWWKDRFSQHSHQLFLQIADRGLPLVLGLVLLFVMGVLLPRHQSPASAGNIPTADEIANAVAQKLPKAAAIPPAPARPTEPYVNPIHSAASKWSFVAGIRAGIMRGSWPADCRIMITRLPVTYSEDLAEDFKQALDVLAWKYEERLATTTVDKEISIRALNGPGPSRECAQTLMSRLHSDAKTRSGSTYQVGLRWLQDKEAPDFLKQCSAACVEVTIGNEDTER